MVELLPVQVDWMPTQVVKAPLQDGCGALTQYLLPKPAPQWPHCLWLQTHSAAPVPEGSGQRAKRRRLAARGCIVPCLCDSGGRDK